MTTNHKKIKLPRLAKVKRVKRVTLNELQSHLLSSYLTQIYSCAGGADWKRLPKTDGRRIIWDCIHAYFELKKEMSILTPIKKGGGK